MAKVSAIKALTGYFNQGDGKRKATDWAAELKELSAAEKTELASLVCALSGDELI